MATNIDSALARLVALGVLLWAADSVAQPRGPDAEVRQRAESLFAEGVRLMSEKRYSEACPKLDEVVRLMPGKIGALVQLGQCEEGAGHLAEALQHHRAARDLAARAGDARAKEIEQMAEALRARVSGIVVRVEDARAGTEVWIDQVRVDPSQWGRQQPVNPGQHVVSARALGRPPWTRTLQAVAGATVEVTVPYLAPAAAAIPSTPPKEAAPTAEAPPTRRGVPPWAWLSLATGIVSLGVGTGFGVDGLVAKGTLERECGQDLANSRCPPKNQYDPTNDNARKNRGLGMFIGFGVAGAAAVSAFAIGVAARGPSNKSSLRLRLVPQLEPSAAGLHLLGSY